MERNKVHLVVVTEGSSGGEHVERAALPEKIIIMWVQALIPEAQIPIRNFYPDPDSNVDDTMSIYLFMMHESTCVPNMVLLSQIITRTIVLLYAAKSQRRLVE